MTHSVYSLAVQAAERELGEEIGYPALVYGERVSLPAKYGEAIGHRPACECASCAVARRDEQIASLRTQLAGGDEVVGALIASNRELYAAMQDYAMDVDEDPPYRHKEMMQRAQSYFSAARAWLRRGEGGR
jgi:hypothetical protein